MKCVVYCTQGNGKLIPPLEFDTLPPYIIVLSDWHHECYRRQFNLFKVDYATETAYFKEDQSQYRKPPTQELAK